VVKKSMIAFFLILGLLVFSVPMAMATPYTVSLTTGPYTYVPGGEFTADPFGFEWVLPLYSDDTSTDTTFQTFCVETGETFVPGTSYDVILSDKSQLTDVTLNLGTAWLYHEFQSGTLQEYDYDNLTGRKNDAGELQAAIWYLMVPSYSDPNNYYSNLVQDSSVTGFTDPFAPNNNTIGVKVMNLTLNGVAIQDQLTCVPDASIMFLLGPAFIALGILGRRKKAKEYL